MQKNDNPSIQDMLNDEEYDEVENLYSKNASLCTKWLENYNTIIWQHLSSKTIKKLYKRFSIPYSKKYNLDDVLETFGTPIVPLSFTIASGNFTSTDMSSLVNSNPYVEEGREIISYDKDNWGLFRTNKPFYGIFKNTNMSKKQQKYFEKLFISSVSLNRQEKNTILRSLATLSRFQLSGLLNVFAEEKNKFHLMYIKNKEDVTKLRKDAEMEWSIVEKELWFYMGINKDNVGKMLDKDRHFTPYAIDKRLKASIKGQDIAVRKIATALYYQTKIHYSNTKDEKLPYKPFDPILLSGSTGSGKTFLLQTGCEFLDLPFVLVDASSLVSAGIRGYCINDIMKDILREANNDLKKAETAVVVLDEVDKLMSSHHDGQSILHQLLRVVEGSKVSLDKNLSREESEFRNIDAINTENMLFIFAGSFQSFLDEKSIKSGFIQSQNTSNTSLGMSDIEKTKLPKELLGRIGDIVILNKLHRDDYRKILLDSKKSPLHRYEEMLAMHNVSYDLDDNEIENILDKVENSSYGARSLNQVVKQIFEDRLFNAPSNYK